MNAGGLVGYDFTEKGCSARIWVSFINEKWGCEPYDTRKTEGVSYVRFKNGIMPLNGSTEALVNLVEV